MNTKNIVQVLLGEFIYGGHLLSLGAVGIVYSVMMLYSFKFDIRFLISVYLIAHAVYFYNRIKDYKSDRLTNSKRSMHLKRYDNYFFSIIVFYVIFTFLILVSFNNLFSAGAGFLILLFGILYSEYFKDVTRKYLGFKNYYVAFFWATLVLYAVLYYHGLFNLTTLIFFIFVFLRWMINTTFFDIKDIKSDIDNGLRTIPAHFGKEKTLKILGLLNLFSFLPILIGVYFNLFPTYFLSFFVFYFYSLYYMRRAMLENSSIQSLSYIVVDGEYVLWPIILTLFK